VRRRRRRRRRSKTKTSSFTSSFSNVRAQNMMECRQARLVRREMMGLCYVRLLGLSCFPTLA